MSKISHLQEQLRKEIDSLIKGIESRYRKQIKQKKLAGRLEAYLQPSLFYCTLFLRILTFWSLFLSWGGPRIGETFNR